MNDHSTRVSQLIQAVASFRIAREWEQFHSPRNLAMAIVTEAAELLEPFRWGDEPSREKIAEELADVLILAFTLALECELDVSQIMIDKIMHNELKYPAQDWRGKSGAS